MRIPLRWVAAAAAGAVMAPAAAFAADPVFTPIGSYATGLAGQESAEIAAFEAGRMFVTNAEDQSVDVVDARDPAAPTRIRRVDLSEYGSPTSVAVDRGLVAVAVAAPVETDPGKVLFLRTDGTIVGMVTVGALPDMVTFVPGGDHVLTANEGQPSGYGPGEVDPEGSISVVSTLPFRLRTLPPLSWWEAGGTVPGAVRTISFRAFNEGGPRHDELPAGVRLNGPGASVAQDLEPEYIAVKDRRTAFVTLQENNAVVEIDPFFARVVRISALGTKDHSQPGNALDASDRDSLINIANWPVHGLYMPDAIAQFSARGRTFYVTGNEGDARDYDGFEDEVQVKDLALDPVAFPNAAELKKDENLGRLAVSATDGKGPDGKYRKLSSFGARSFTVWDDRGRRVWDSGDAFERITAQVVPAAFNANNTSAAFDNRSDNKGPEPEGVTTGRIGTSTYAFVGMERIGGFMVFDVTDPGAPEFVQWANNRDYTKGAAPDSGPEGLVFLPRWESPTRRPLVVVSNEISGTVTFYEAREPGEAATLSLLHNNDGESSLLPINNNTASGVLKTGGADAFKAVTNREITRARAGRSSVATVYAGDAFLASATIACSLPPFPASTPVYDALAQRQIAYDAHILGNHEFDFGPDYLERFIRGFTDNGRLTQPFLSANLDFAAEPGLNALTQPGGTIVGEATDGKVIAKSMIHRDPTTGQRFGIVGATTWTLPTISSPRGVVVTSTDVASTATVVQQEVDRIRNLYGIEKVIFVSHLQDVANDRSLIALLKGVDLAVAGGGDEILANGPSELLPGESEPIRGTYPILQADADGVQVPIVTTGGNYKYLGRLDVRFDEAGKVAQVLAGSGPRRVIPTGVNSASLLTALGVTDAVTRDAGIVKTVTTPVTACLSTFSQPIVGTEVQLDTSRGGNRSRETNAGNTITDAYLATYDRFAAGAGLPPRGGANRVIAIQNGGGIRQNAGDRVPAVAPAPGTPGTISRLDTLNVLAFFNNQVTVVSDVTPADLEQILERSASANASGGGQFLQVAGVKVAFDRGRQAQVVTGAGVVTTPGQRVLSATLADGTKIIDGGELVAGAPSVRIVTNSFTASNPPVGGDIYPWLFNNPNKVDLPINYELAWADYLRSFPAGPVGGQTLPIVPASNLDYATLNPARRITITP